MKIAIRYGHLFHGADTGAEGYVKETDVNRRYGALVIKKLQALGYEVINVTPPEGSCNTLSESLYYGIDKANNEKADLFLSCHVNANVTTNSPMGCEVVYNGNKQNSPVALNICLELARLGFKNRGAKVDVRGLAEIRSTHMPCYIIEPFFVDSRADVDLYNKVGDEGIANAIVKGVTGKNILGTPNNLIPHILKKGDSGEAVKLLQTMLNKLKFDCGVADGVFGSKTDQAVRKFQEKYKIAVDGVVGPATFGKLKVLAK